MDYLAFVNSLLAHDSDSWNEVMRNLVYSTLHSLFEKIFSPPVSECLATAALLCALIGQYG